MNSLKDIGNFNQQLSIFMNSIRPEFPAIIDKYKMVCCDLENALKKEFKMCYVHAFGSTITGLCFKDSDVDVFVQLPAEMIRNYESDELLRMARKALFRSSKTFNNIVCIFRAKTPIIKCCHIPTGIRCDFNFRSMLGVCNSRLISYYLSLDDKITQAMIILKFWAKIHEVNGSQKFTNYALTMMLIFYLQQPPLNLPSVKSLQTTFIFMQEGWNAGFLPLQNFYSDSLRNSSVLELLKGFFNFYSTFDFGLYVISPYVGEKIPKINFFDTDNLSDDFIRYKEYLRTTPNSLPLCLESAVCIQDPFELSRNLSGVVHVRVLDWFVKCCKLSCNELISSNENKILYRLFTVSPQIKMISNETLRFSIRITGNLKYFYENLEPATRTIDTLRNVWFETLNNFLLSVLTLVLKLDVDVQPTAATMHKSQRLENQKDVYDNDLIDSIVFHCTGRRNLWEQRKSWIKNSASDFEIPEETTLLDKEVALTNYICRDGIILTDILVDFNLLVTARKNPTLVEFELKRNEGDKNAFHTLCVFFTANFVSWFTSHLNEKKLHKYK